MIFLVLNAIPGYEKNMVCNMCIFVLFLWIENQNDASMETGSPKPTDRITANVKVIYDFYLTSNYY